METILELQEQLERCKADWERESVRHAGCLTAAEGWAGDNPPKKGDWGWSPALQAVLDLRKRLEHTEKQRDVAQALISKIQDIVEAAFPGQRHSEFDVLDQGVRLLTKRLEQCEAIERKRCEIWAANLTAHEPDCSVYNADVAVTHECYCRRSILLLAIRTGLSCGYDAARAALEGKMTFPTIDEILRLVRDQVSPRVSESLRLLLHKSFMWVPEYYPQIEPDIKPPIRQWYEQSNLEFKTDLRNHPPVEK